MRLCILALTAVAGLAAATAAFASGVHGSALSPAGPGWASNDTYRRGDIDARAQQSYAERLAALRQKVLRISAEDGGELSLADFAALQRELKAINAEYAENSPAPSWAMRR